MDDRNINCVIFAVNNWIKVLSFVKPIDSFMLSCSKSVFIVDGSCDRSQLSQLHRSILREITRIHLKETNISHCSIAIAFDDWPEMVFRALLTVDINSTRSVSVYGAHSCQAKYSFFDCYQNIPWMDYSFWLAINVDAQFIYTKKYIFIFRFSIQIRDFQELYERHTHKIHVNNIKVKFIFTEIHEYV